MGSIEDVRRIDLIAEESKRDGISTDEFIKRILQSAIRTGNPFINPNSQFIVLGFDGFPRNIFPCGSFDDADEAVECARRKTEGESLYSDGEEISATFHVFTKEGMLVSK